MLMKTEISEKIKKAEVPVINDYSSSEQNFKIEEEEKETEGKKHAINKIIKNHVKSSGNREQVGSSSTTMSLFNNENL